MGRMAHHAVRSSPTLTVSVRTREGCLAVVARQRKDRWTVVAQCGTWRGFGVGGSIRAAADAALAPYASGVDLDGGGAHGSRNPEGLRPR